MIENNEISLKQGDDVINNEGKVAEFLSNAHINVVENTDRKKPLTVFDKDNLTFSITINTILEEYKYQPSVLNIKKHSELVKCFSFSDVTTTDVLKLIKSTSINKTNYHQDQLPPKLIQTDSNFFAEPFTDTSTPALIQVLSLPGKKSLSYTYKGGSDKHIYTNYRPVSVLSTSLKIIEPSMIN